MASLFIVWITDAMLNIFFLYVANEKCESMSSHSEKYSSSSFIHHVPMLRKNLKRPMYFYLFLNVSFLYYCHHCGTVHLHPDTILRKHGVHQCLKCLVVIKARTPRLKQLCLHSCHLVGDFIISVSLTLSLVYLLPSGKAPNTCINLGPSKVVGLISLSTYSAT